MEKNLEIVAEFNTLFPTEDSCKEHLVHLRWPDGFVCPRCGWRKAWQIQPYKFKCRGPGCAYQVTPTAGTLFHRSHLSLREWYLAVWYTAVVGSASITAEQLREYVGLGSIHTALRLRHTLGTYNPVFFSQLQNYDAGMFRLQGHVEITGCSLPYEGTNIPVILAQDSRTEPIRFYARQSVDFSAKSLHDFISRYVSKHSGLVIDTETFKQNGFISLLPGYRTDLSSNSTHEPLSVFDTAEKLQKEWSWMNAKDKKCPLGEFLANYPSRQSDPCGHRFNFERLIDSLIRKVRDEVL